MSNGYNRGGGAGQALTLDESVEAATYRADECERKAAPGAKPFKTDRAGYIKWLSRLFRESAKDFGEGREALERARGHRVGEAQADAGAEERRAMEGRREAARWPHADGCRCGRSSPRACPALHNRELDFKTFTTEAGLGFRVALNRTERQADLDERRWLDIPEWVEAIGGDLREALDVAYRSHGEEILERIELEAAQKLCDANPALSRKYGTRGFLALYPIQWKLRDEFARGIAKLAREAEGVHS